MDQRVADLLIVGLCHATYATPRILCWPVNTRHATRLGLLR